MNMENRFDPVQLAERADHYFIGQGLTCSEACLMAGAEALGVDSPLLPGIALALGGGVGMQGEVCGAISGCALAISLAAQRLAKEDYLERLAFAVGAAGRIHQAFAVHCGSAICRDICGLDLTTTEGIQQLMAGVRERKCAPVVKIATRLLASELNRLDQLA